MLESFLFSTNIVLPSFFLIVLGRLITQKDWLSQQEMDRISKLAFRYLIPIKIFLEVATADLKNLSALPLASYCTVIMIVMVLLSVLAARVFKVKKASAGAYMQNCFRGSFTILGLPMIEAYAGPSGTTKCAILIALIAIESTVFASLVLEHGSSGESRMKRAKEMLCAIVSNPLFIASVLGVGVSVFSVRIPAAIRSTLNSLSVMAAPLSLLCVGSGLNFQTVKSNLWLSVATSVIKTILTPFIFVPIAVLCGFRGVDLFAVTVYSTAANPSVGYVMALTTNNDSALAASGVVVSTILSVFSTTAFVFLLRLQGFI